KHYLTLFCKQWGRLTCAQLRPFHLTRWIDGQKHWTGAKRSAQAIVKRAFAWSKSEGLIGEDPLANVKNPPVTRRERIISAEERKQITAAIKDDAFMDFFDAIVGTGCRPGEVAKVSSENVNLELGVWVFKQHKTAKKTRRPRVVYLSPAMLELTKRKL